ncbi:DUF2290 domain-containing protein [Bosea robiniae]|uniref:DUF2290 domain-containing protein n=1 Tax=Bosea robiniae TaxID=1036780 RepID=A0ABY0NDE3_9HYPH|nr:DUF2290 domain-containing protein [Bosea robiniae]SDF29530.1 hypothetical protein SAMN05421844_101271 [Bosea robiniae]
MSTAEGILSEIRELTSELISSGLCVDQNFPAMRTGAGGVISIDISGEEERDLSVTLKNIPYSESYAVLVSQRSFNLKMIDGGLIQMMYQFRNRELINHRLAFFPSPDLLEYQNNPDIYETDEMYGDIVSRNIVTSPIRFDFDRDNFVENDHPMSHLTIGQYKNCRIPVSGPLSPFLFLNFILRAFYNTPFRKYCSDIKRREYTFSSSITKSEMLNTHIQACSA